MTLISATTKVVFCVATPLTLDHIFSQTNTTTVSFRSTLISKLQVEMWVDKLHENQLYRYWFVI